MKDKILVFIIGLLVGAIITATGFLIYEKTNKNSNTNQMPNDGQIINTVEMSNMSNGTLKDLPDGNGGGPVCILACKSSQIKRPCKCWNINKLQGLL